MCDVVTFEIACGQGRPFVSFVGNLKISSVPMQRHVLLNRFDNHFIAFYELSSVVIVPCFISISFYGNKKVPSPLDCREKTT